MRSNKWIDHVLVLFFVFIMAGILTGCQESALKTGKASQSATPAQVPQMDAKTVKALLPESVGKGKPAVIDFYTQFCLACQQLEPKLEKLSARTPEVTFLRMDIQHPSKQDKAIMEAFHVKTVPYVAFIAPSGEVKQVILEDASDEALDKAVADLVKAYQSCSKDTKGC